jgi:Na+/H+ antiporter NhaD/arsenite permease-like protein
MTTSDADPSPQAAVALDLFAVAVVGGGLAALVNNLPAAAFGAAWLGVSSAPLIVAFLIGTNFAAIITPHGSVATMLARSAARHHGHDDGLASYLASAWRYAAVTTVAAVGALALFR